MTTPTSRLFACLSLGLPLALFASGCLMTSADRNKIRSENQARDRRLDRLEAQSQKAREEVDAKLTELQQVIDQATQVVTRGSADVGAQVEQLRAQLATVEGLMAELKYKVDGFDQQLASQRTSFEEQMAKQRAAPPKESEPAVPAEKDAHFLAAQQRYQSGEYDKARNLFREYVTRYAKDAKAGEAQYWVGATYTRQEKPAAALGEYRKVIAEFGKSSAVNVALYGLGDAFYQLKACTDAKNALQALIKRKPEPSLLGRTKKLLKDVTSAPRSACSS
jgi:TolA-binding protein